MIRAMRNLCGFVLCLLLDCPGAFTQSHENTQPPTSRQTQQIETHGTCATVEATDSKMAFIIDSRMSRISENKLIGFQEGCKVALVRPTVLIAATGVEDD